MSEYKLIGELPKGDWSFCLVTVVGSPDVIIVVDKTGRNEPRMVVNGKLTTVKPR